ncbi:competence protein CoiA family protein [Staphylococcus equorum]|uniref:competence protein CoiA family protein n=1 Tax=Staphylococcus equorum TaxID=246432 RepID=UPI003D808A18
MIAQKGHQYTCPHCHNKVIFKKGQFIAPHFAHVSERGLHAIKEKLMNTIDLNTSLLNGLKNIIMMLP